MLLGQTVPPESTLVFLYSKKTDMWIRLMTVNTQHAVFGGLCSLSPDELDGCCLVLCVYLLVMKGVSKQLVVDVTRRVDGVHFTKEFILPRVTDLSYRAVRRDEPSIAV